MEDNNFSRQTFYVLFFLGIVAAFFAMKTLSSIILPVIFAILLGFVFLPVVKKLSQKLHLPWAISSILVTLLVVVVFLGLFSLLFSSLSSILGNYSRYESRLFLIMEKFNNIIDLGFDEQKSFFENLWGFEKIRSIIQNTALLLSSGVLSSGKSIMTVFLLTAFFMLEMNRPERKIQLAFPEKSEQIIQIGKNIINEVAGFLSIKFFASLGTGLIVFVFTLLLRMDFPVVWGFLAFCMNFIPIFGSIISSVFTILFALIQFYPNLWQAVLVAIFMLTVNMVIGNIIEPKVEGEGLGLSPFVILIMLSVWGYIWGFLGMLLAVPMTVMIKIICENIDYLKPIAALLGNGKENKN